MSSPLPRPAITDKARGLEDPDELKGIGGLWIDAGLSVGLIATTAAIVVWAGFLLLTDSSCWAGSTSLTCSAGAPRLVHGLGAVGGLASVGSLIAAWLSRGHRRFWLAWGYIVHAFLTCGVCLITSQGAS